MRPAVRVLVLCVILDLVLGLAFGLVTGVGAWNGLYFATTTATTVGYGDITPHGWLPHLITVLIMITVIPLFSAFFSLMGAGLTARHVDRRHAEMKQHVSKECNGQPEGSPQRPGEADPGLHLPGAPG